MNKGVFKVRPTQPPHKFFEVVPPHTHTHTRGMGVCAGLKLKSEFVSRMLKQLFAANELISCVDLREYLELVHFVQRQEQLTFDR